MDFTRPEEVTVAADLADRMFGDSCQPAQLRALERSADTGRFDAALWAALCSAGLTAVSLAEAAGGLGLGLLGGAAICRAAGRNAAPVPLAETISAALAIAAGGPTERLADAAISGLTDGSAVLGLALIRTEDVATTEDGEPTISASLVDVSYGAVLTHLVIVAVDNGVGALNSVEGAWLVDMSAPGLAAEATRSTMGSPDANITLSAVPCSALDSAGVAPALIAAELLCSATVLGHSDAALDLTAEYTKQRRQFEVPIATFQAVAHRAADAAIARSAIELTLDHAAFRFDEGLDCAQEVAVSSYWAHEGAAQITRAAQHLHGGIGVDRDYPLHRHYLAARHYLVCSGGPTLALDRLGQLIAGSERATSGGTGASAA